MNDAHEVARVLEYRTTEVTGLEDAIGVHAWHWSLSGIIRPGQRRECEVGKRVQLVCRMATTVAFELLRTPQGSRTTLTGTAFTPSAPGLYTLLITIAGFTRTIEFIAVSTELLDKIGPMAGLQNRLLTVRGRINSGAVSADELIAALETTPPTWGSLASPA